MDNALRKIVIDEDYFVYDTGVRYWSFDKDKYRSLFRKIKEERKFFGEYDDAVWIGFSGIKRFRIDFMFNSFAYKTHAYKFLEIPVADLINMLKGYVLFVYGEYTFHHIENRIFVIKEFLTTNFEEKEVDDDWKNMVEDFLWFIGIPEKQIDSILDGIISVKRKQSGVRELKPLINYLAIANELSDIYGGDLEDEEYIYWFPVYFWAHITFILPLRATEMIVTPHNCIERKNGKVYLSVRRTQLKKGKKTVHYNVDDDYKIFKYEVPDTQVIKNIEKYKALTICQERRFLFTYNPNSINEIFSLERFNDLLKEFVNTYLKGNHKYDYARYASGIKEFELVTAGDSRPIAMANLYFQNTGAEICRQLADHMNVSTSEGYFMNISKTVYAASIMQLQRKLNLGYKDLSDYENYYSRYTGQVPKSMTSSCGSHRRPKITGDIRDCIKEGHIDECLGCRYYTPGEAELEKALSERREKLDKSSKAVLAYMKNNKKDRIEDFERIFLEAYTRITRYKTVCDNKAREELRKWQRHHHTQTTSS